MVPAGYANYRIEDGTIIAHPTFGTGKQPLAFCFAVSLPTAALSPPFITGLLPFAAFPRDFAAFAANAFVCCMWSRCHPLPFPVVFTAFACDFAAFHCLYVWCSSPPLPAVPTYTPCGTKDMRCT